MHTPRRVAHLVVPMLIGLAALSPPARPCSIAVVRMGGLVDGATVGPTPIFFGLLGPQLTPVDDPRTVIALIPVPELGVVMVAGQPGQAWRPAEPLPAGQYAAHGVQTLSGDPLSSGVRFFVDPDLVEDPPEVPSVDLNLVLTEPEDESGCTFDGDSCSDIDFTRLEVVRAADREGDQILLSVENPLTGERRRAVFGSLQPGPLRVTLFELTHGGLIPGSLKKDRLCYAVTPLSEAGTLGEELDLGCIRPTDNDPRTEDQRGCAGAPGSNLFNLGLWLLALVLARSRSHRRDRRLTS
ncbi:MAG TPA: hypothetical protein PK095_04030 [Myxococcota bacterium]|nr:hypothetical protein [Myxococcota bacterium]